MNVDQHLLSSRICQGNNENILLLNMMKLKPNAKKKKAIVRQTKQQRLILSHLKSQMNEKHFQLEGKNY